MEVKLNEYIDDCLNRHAYIKLYNVLYRIELAFKGGTAPKSLDMITKDLPSYFYYDLICNYRIDRAFVAMYKMHLALRRFNRDSLVWQVILPTKRRRIYAIFEEGAAVFFTQFKLEYLAIKPTHFKISKENHFMREMTYTTKWISCVSRIYKTFNLRHSTQIINNIKFPNITEINSIIYLNT